MSHGNVATHHGTCQTCGRADVDLRPSRVENRKTSERTFVCVDEFACFAAWKSLVSS